MKLQLVTAAAALLAASVAALPAPLPVDNNHGLLPDTDDWVDDDGIVEARDTDVEVADVLEARDDRGSGAAVEDIDFGEVIAVRDVDGDGDDVVATIEVVESRDDHVTEVDEGVSETIAARDVEEDDVTATIEVLEAGDSDISEAAANFNFTSDFDFALDRLLAEIESIPDDVLAAGDEALHKWLVEHGDRAGDDSENLKRDEDSSDIEGLTTLLERGELMARASWWKVTKCVAAIVQLLATTAVPAAKLLRIKKYIEALGGVKQAVQLLLGATTKAEKLKAGGEALVALSAELLGISTVKNNCF
ncbi:hypothetical protein C8A03DRAFT_18379 [Achaetomium macrosporum]|uniref:Uncharacterized protein n=1 Tax=Achaetomium macrosporum TaxID=79813 RepID=A0AAN7H4Q2_9PEZI|nr:hypothetical protein C8A03DRAFT_18379 [Achaetomium macrosporum]